MSESLATTRIPPRARVEACSRCKAVAPVYSLASGEGMICSECQLQLRAEEERAAILGGLDALVLKQLTRLGLGKRYLGAEREAVPARIRQALGKHGSQAFGRGETVTTGFGVGGPAGCGKTMALAVLVKARMRAWCEATAKGKTPHLATMPQHGMAWADWPGTVRWIRANATSPDVQVRVEELSTVPILVLDDLGAERIRGSYAEDFAASMLDAIVDGRHVGCLPTWYTTNLNREGLETLYGPRLVSRLLGDNPLVVLAGASDLRGDA